MTNDRSVLDRALDTAIELLTEQTPPLPSTPSSGAVCADLGVGASTFYRIFESSDDYREQLVKRLLLHPNLTAEQPLLDVLAELSGSLVDGGELDMAEAIFVAARAFEEARVAIELIEADWLPWVRNPVVRRSHEASTRKALAAELPAVEDLIALAGLHFIGSTDGTDFMLRQAAVTIGSSICGIDDVIWPAGDRELSLVLAARWRLSLMMLAYAGDGLEER